MKTMMSKMLKAVGVKEKEGELSYSPVEMSSDNGFVQVRSRKKKRLKRSQGSHRRSHACSRSSSNSSELSASDNEEGNTMEFAQKRFLAKDVKAKSVKDILLIGIKTIEKVVTEKADPLPVIRHVKFLAEKSTKKMFEPVAFIKYNEPVGPVSMRKAHPSLVSSKPMRCIPTLAWKIQ